MNYRLRSITESDIDSKGACIIFQNKKSVQLKPEMSTIDKLNLVVNTDFVCQLSLCMELKIKNSNTFLLFFWFGLTDYYSNNELSLWIKNQVTKCNFFKIGFLITREVLILLYIQHQRIYNAIAAFQSIFCVLKGTYFSWRSTDIKLHWAINKFSVVKCYFFLISWYHLINSTPKVARYCTSYVQPLPLETNQFIWKNLAMSSFGADGL